MKVCPNCAFVNDERFAICAYCNKSLADVPVTLSTDPDAPEHERRRLVEQRQQRSGGQLRVAATCYVVLLTGSALFPGFVFDPVVLALYLASSLVVAVALVRGMAGQFTASLLQGVCSAVLILYFGPMQFMIFFMFALHVMLPTLLWHWTELIHGANH